MVFEDTESALFGVAGLQVTSVEAAPDGGIEVWASQPWRLPGHARIAARSLTGCTRRW
jgi:hypothetical protein